MNTNTEDQLVAEYCDALIALKTHRHLKLPDGSKCKVDHGRYKGEGVVFYEGGCPPNQVPVKLPSGNVWWYPIESVTRIN